MVRSPLDIPEVALHISLYLNRKDYAICCLVCRDWNNTFGDLLYRTVDILPFDRFWKNPSSESLLSYGHSIRELRFSGLIPLSVYSIPNCTRLEKLSIDTNWHIEWRRRFTAQLDKEIGSSSEDPVSETPSPEDVQWNKMESEFWVPDFPELVSMALVGLMRQSVRSLHTIHLYDQTQLLPEFWTILAATPQIKTLHMARCHVQPSDMPAFWKACTTHIKTLVINYSKLGIPLPDPDLRKARAVLFNVDHALDPLQASLPFMVQFPNLENLTLECLPTLSIQAQVQMAMQCPSLKFFRWRPADKTPNVSEDLLRWMTHRGACPMLDSLELNCSGTTDEALAAVLEGMPPATMLIMAWSGFGQEAALSLMCRHSDSIRILHLYNCPSVTSLMVLDILASCPGLEQFMGDSILASDMVPKSALLNRNGEEEDEKKKQDEEDWDTGEIEDLTREFNNLLSLNPSKDSEGEEGGEEFGFLEGGARDWVCLGIKILKINFFLTPVVLKNCSFTGKVDNDQPSTVVELQRKHDREQYFVLRQLTRLKQLEQLEMYPRLEMFPIDGRRTVAGLDLRLKSRGGQLEPFANRLPKLRILNLMICGEESWSEQEVDWVTREWTSMGSLLGRLAKEPYRDAEIKNLFNEKRHTFLAERNRQRMTR